MGTAAIIAFEAVRARKPWDVLRQQRPSCFAQCLDGLAASLPKPALTFARVTETVWQQRHALTGSLTETLVAHVPQRESTRTQRNGPPGARLVPARAPVSWTV